MPLPLIAAAIAAGGIRAGIGLLQGRSDTRRKRNQITDAYNRGKARMDIHQQDVRQSEGESLGQRGLAQGGDVRVGSAVSPTSTAEYAGLNSKQGEWEAQQQAAKEAAMSVSGAHTLGGQQQADLHREQLLEQNDLQAQKDNALSDVNAEGTQNAIGSIASGISTGFQVAGMGGGGTPSIASAYTQAGQDPYFNGIHPTNPDMGSDWSGGLAQPGTTNAGFTKYGNY